MHNTVPTGPKKPRTKQTARKSAPSSGWSTEEREGRIWKIYVDTDPISDKEIDRYDYESSDGYERPAKRRRRELPTSPGHVNPDEIIKGLKAQIAELHKFIEDRGLALKAPLSIRNHMKARQSGAEALAATISNDIEKVYESLDDDCCDAAHTGITSDDISEAMCVFLPEIYKLSKLPNGVPLAFDLTVKLGEHSYGELDTKHGSGFGDRPSDEPTDMLMCQLFKARLSADPTWDFNDVLHDLKAVSLGLADYGINGFMHRTIKAMEAEASTQADVPDIVEISDDDAV